MSFSRTFIVFSVMVAAAGCSTSPNHQDTDMVNTDAIDYSRPIMRHSLREMVRYDSYNMSRLVNKEINMKEKDENAFLRDAEMVLTQTVLVQPHFPERQVALRELKSKLDQEDYLVILEQAADNLIYLAKSPNPSDQAGAVVALDNLIIEGDALHREELKPTFQKIIDSKIKISSEAKRYALEPMAKLTPPSDMALAALSPAKK